MAGGCSTVSPESFPVIHAHGPDGAGSTNQTDADTLEGAEGYVLSYAKGDRVEVEFTLDSDVMRLEDPVRFVIVLERAIRVASSPAGMLVSIENGPWRPPMDAFDGDVSTGLSIPADEPVNRASIRIKALAN